MDPLSVTSGVIQLISLARAVLSYTFSVTNRFDYIKLYGISGLALSLFGSPVVWQLQAKVLGSLDDKDALEFRKSMQDECTMTAVAAAIVAQIAITALSLSSLSQTHWVARGCWVFSLISALMVVYYACGQQRIMGRLLYPQQIRAWIRAFPFSDFFSHKKLDEVSEIEVLAKSLGKSYRGNSQREIDWQHFRPFLPGVASIIIVSAPELLLSASLNSFLVGLGVYLGFIWARNLDLLAGANDSRDVFIVYIVSIALCYIVYSLASSVQNDQEVTAPRLVVLESLERFKKQVYSKFQRMDENVQQERFEEQNNASAAEKGEIPPDPKASSMHNAEETTHYEETSSWALPSKQATTIPSKNRDPPPNLQEQDLPSQEPLGLDHTSIIQALTESARLRRESAKVEELIAQYYEKLITGQKTTVPVPPAIAQPAQ